MRNVELLCNEQRQWLILNDTNDDKVEMLGNVFKPRYEMMEGRAGYSAGAAV